jgi:hypothetical protein
VTNAIALPARAALAEVAPLVRRAADLDPATLVRLRVESRTVSAFVLLPFAVLAGRAVPLDHTPPALDSTYAAGSLLTWIDDTAADPPERCDTQWRGGLPPAAHWTRLDSVPEDVVRDLVRTGALTLKEAAEREGVPGAQPRAEVADALLDSIVLTVSGGTDRVEISLRLVSALVRMGFLPRGSRVSVEITPRWLRVAGKYGSVYAERPGVGLQLR